MHYAVDSTTDNANFAHQVAYMCENAAKLPWDLNSQLWEHWSLEDHLNHSATEAHMYVYVT